mgnify:CR=1 FL=1
MLLLVNHFHLKKDLNLKSGESELEIREGNNISVLYKIFGGLFIAFGLFMSATGLYWQEAMTAFLTATNWSANLELWIPFWPFEPYLSLLVISS